MANSLHKFYFDAIIRTKSTSERYGQAIFNHLLTVRPDLAEQIRGTDKDPFYCKVPWADQYRRFVAFLETHWSPPNGEPVNPSNNGECS